MHLLRYDKYLHFSFIRIAWQMSFMACVFFGSLRRFNFLSFICLHGKSVKTDKIAYFPMKGVDPEG